MKNRMVMARAPLRISFVGGGTDIPFYYKKSGYGAVVSAAINKFIYVAVNKKFDNKIRVSYSRTEIVDNLDEISHPSVRESLRLLELNKSIEIVSISDVPSQGTGLGSSSTFLVALLHALHSYKGEFVDAEQLAQEAVHIERNVLREAGGKQDQYMAAYGNIDLMKFHSDERVDILPISINEENMKRIEESLLLLYLERERSSSHIIEDQGVSADSQRAVYDEFTKMAEDSCKYMVDGDVPELGSLVMKYWNLKRELSSRISDGRIDDAILKASEMGAFGGQVIGAGGGGFLMFIADPQIHQRIANSLGLKKLDFRFQFGGSRLIFVGD
ncbi:MAG: kinase [Candidatus Thermoplasmatota archaeon]|nr:kinase [Candidatus Thermoplasmatota archaeon]